MVRTILAMAVCTMPITLSVNYFTQKLINSCAFCKQRYLRYQEVINTTISGESMRIEKGIARIDTTINLRAEVFEYLDECFKLIGLTWNDFFQREIEDSIESLRDNASCWLGELIQNKLKQI